MDGGVNLPSHSSPSSNQIGNTLNFGSENFPALNGSSLPIKDLGGNRTGSQSYISCFKDPLAISTSSSIKLGYEEPRKDINEFAFFSSGELQPHIAMCESFLVGYFVGKRLDFNFVKENLTSLWKTKGEFSMAIHGEQAFMFKFSLEEDRARVLELGSVHIAQKLFLIRPWSPFLEQQIDSISSVLIWMNLRGVPLHLWNATGFSRISSLVGKPIMTDAPTAMKTRMSFARVCVEIDANCSFPSKLPFQIDDMKYEVRAEYPWKPSACSHCKSFGHTSGKCISNPAPKYTKRWVPKKNHFFNSASEPNPIEISQSVENSVSIGAANEKDDPPILENVIPTGDIVRKDCEFPVVEIQPVEEEWVAYSRRKKHTRRIEDAPFSENVGQSNSFSVLGLESAEQNLKNNEDDAIPIANDSASSGEIMELGIEDLFNTVEHHIKQSEVQGFVADKDLNSTHAATDIEGNESSGDDMEIVKEKSLADIPIKIHKTKAQRIADISALIGDPSGKQANMSIFSELNDKYQKSRKERELEKLGWKEEPKNDKLGRGHRKSAKKK